MASFVTLRKTLPALQFLCKRHRVNALALDSIGLNPRDRAGLRIACRREHTH